jgi:hypothetical protein
MTRLLPRVPLRSRPKCLSYVWVPCRRGSSLRACLHQPGSRPVGRNGSFVPELEARARAAGLGERQQITRAKRFQRAKRGLGIRSVRTGFGARSQWLWQLPQQSGASIESTARERRGPIPIDWVQGVACLHPDRPPSDVPRHRWRQFVDDCKNLLSSPEKWAERAAGLGWDAMALFGCAPKLPRDNQDERPATIKMRMARGGRLTEGGRSPTEVRLPSGGRVFPREQTVVVWRSERLGAASDSSSREGSAACLADISPTARRGCT